jgi:hypothetical protein
VAAACMAQELPKAEAHCTCSLPHGGIEINAGVERSQRYWHLERSRMKGLVYDANLFQDMSDSHDKFSLPLHRGRSSALLFHPHARVMGYIRLSSAGILLKCNTFTPAP